jgi:Methyltransferase domain
MTHSARRINNLAHRLAMRSYLEIGVCDGETFRLIEMPARTGVDPEFRFNPDTIRDQSTRLVSQTSDAYFATLPISEKFDLIFIDGLHTFEQVVRDFSNAVLHTHDRSVILIDDTRPSDVYSALRHPGETSRFRNIFNSASKDWHGDVFKAVFYISDFWPSMNYRTIASGGNPQTLVWRSIKGPREPLFDNLETISRLTFFEFCDHAAVLRSGTEEDTIGQCIAELEEQAGH